MPELDTLLQMPSVLLCCQIQLLLLLMKELQQVLDSSGHVHISVTQQLHTCTIIFIKDCAGVCLFYFSVHLCLRFHSPDAWTSVTYCSSSWPWWMTSNVRLFIVSALSAWCCNLCSARVRSSVSKSLICCDSSSFHDSKSEIICKESKRDFYQSNA